MPGDLIAQQTRNVGAARTKRRSGPAEIVPLYRPRDRGYLLADTIEAGLRRLLAAGMTIVIAARASDPNSKYAVLEMIKVLLAAIARLLAAGIDLSPATGQLDTNALFHRFISEATVEKTRDVDGNEFVNRFLVIDDFLPQGVILWLSCGSANKLDESFNQPAVDHFIEHIVKRYTPALTYSVELIRVARRVSAMDKLIDALAHLSERCGALVYVGDAEISISPMTERVQDEMRAEAKHSESEIRKFRRRSHDGTEQGMGTAMTDGRVWLGTPASAWPGTASAHVIDPETGVARMMRYIDSPNSRPPASQVTRRVEQESITLPDGNSAPDNAASVCWYLDHLYQPGYDEAVCGEIMRSRGYSTERLRRLASHNVTFDAGTTPRERAICDRCIRDGILDHLDEYETGEFAVHLAFDPNCRVVANVLPERGYWLSPQSGARIRAERDQRRRPNGGRNPHLFSGLPVTVDGKPARLKYKAVRGVPHYQVARTNRDRSGGRTRADATPMIREADLVGVLVTAIVDSHVELPRLTRHSDVSDVTAKVTALGERLQRLERARARYETVLEDPRLPLDQAMKYIRGRYESTIAEIERARTALASAEYEMQTLASPTPLGVPVRDLLDFIAEMANPRSQYARALIQRGLQNVTLHASRQRSGKITWWHLALQATLRIHNDEDTFQLPIHGSLEGGPAVKLRSRLVAAIHGLYQGHHLRDTFGSDYMRHLSTIKAMLGLGPADPFVLHRIDDERLRRLTMLICHPRRDPPGALVDGEFPVLAGPPLDDTGLKALARRTKEPLVLLRRIRALYAPDHATGSAIASHPLRPAAMWLTHNSIPVAIAFLEAARRHGACPIRLPGGPKTIVAGRFADEWTRDGDVLRLRPCSTCGTTTRIPLRLREADGSICRGCRTDRSGVVWPTVYDQYAYDLTTQRHHMSRSAA